MEGSRCCDDPQRLWSEFATACFFQTIYRHVRAVSEVSVNWFVAQTQKDNGRSKGVRNESTHTQTLSSLCMWARLHSLLQHGQTRIP